MALAIPRKSSFIRPVPRPVIEHSLAQRALLAQRMKGASAATHLKILIVDDESSMRLLLRRTLELGFHIVFEAANGTAALRMIEQIQPDIVLLDINLPDMDGIAVLQEVRKSDFTIGVLMVSALNDRRWIEQAQQEGADGFIGKPYTVKEMLSAIAQLADQVTGRRNEPVFATMTPSAAL